MTDKIDLENDETETTPARKPWVRPNVQRITVEGTEANNTSAVPGADGLLYANPS